MLKARPGAIAKVLKGDDTGAVNFDVDGGTKDLRAMLDEGRARGLELPLVERSLACYEEAARNGLGAADLSAVSVYWSNRKSP